MAQCKKTNFSSYQISSIKNVPVKNSKFTMTFSSESYAENIVTKDNQFITTKHTFKKTYKKEGQVSEFQQLQRPYYRKETTQGGKKYFVTKKVTTNSMNFIDILIVLDNSGSMGNEHTKIKNKLPFLIEHIKNKEWQIRLVTTDKDDKCFKFPIIRSSMTDGLQKLKTQIEQAGISGSGSERGIYKTAVGLGLLSSECQWVRDPSRIAVLIVSDEVNYSDTNKPAKYLELEQKIKNHPKFGIEKFNSLKAFGILLPDKNNPAKKCSGGGGPADLLSQEYYQFINHTQGQSYSICPDDYSEIFDELSKSFAQQLATISLDSQPALDTLVIKINGFKKVINKDYKVNGKKLNFWFRHQMELILIFHIIRYLNLCF